MGHELGRLPGLAAHLRERRLPRLGILRLGCFRARLDQQAVASLEAQGGILPVVGLAPLLPVAVAAPIAYSTDQQSNGRLAVG